MNRSSEHPTERREEHPAADAPAADQARVADVPAGAGAPPADTAVQAPVQPPTTPDEPTPLVGDA